MTILTDDEFQAIRARYAMMGKGCSFSILEGNIVDIPALLDHIEAQQAALEQAWYVLDAAAAGVVPKVAAVMARTHVEKFIVVRESNFDDATKEAASE